MANPITGSAVRDSNFTLRLLIYFFVAILIVGAGVYMQSSKFVDSAPDLSTAGYVTKLNGALANPHVRQSAKTSQQQDFIDTQN